MESLCDQEPSLCPLIRAGIEAFHVRCGTYERRIASNRRHCGTDGSLLILWVSLVIQHQLTSTVI